MIHALTLQKLQLNNGAQPSDTVKNLLSKEGIIKKFADSKSGK